MAAMLLNQGLQIVAMFLSRALQGCPRHGSKSWLANWRPAPAKPRLWKRYMDDTCCIVKKGTVEGLLSHLNSVRPSIRLKSSAIRTLCRIIHAPGSASQLIVFMHGLLVYYHAHVWWFAASFQTNVVIHARIHGCILLALMYSGCIQ